MKKITTCIIVLGIISGIFFLLKPSLASGPWDTLVLEAESGVLAGNVAIGSDVTASNGQYIQFVAPSATPTLLPPTPTVTPKLTPTPTITPTPTPTPIPGQLVVTTISPVLSGNGLNSPKGEAVVNGIIWVVNSATNSISLFNKDGTSAGSVITGNGLTNPYGIVFVQGVGGSTVWVTNKNAVNGKYTISLFNPNGISAGSVLFGNGLSAPKDIAVVGNQVWVSNANNSTISRFNIDGTPAGPVIKGNGLSNPGGIQVVGSEVWIVNDKANSTISRFNLNGGQSNPQITGNGMLSSKAITRIGPEVWIINNNGGINNNGSISRFSTSGLAIGIIPPPSGKLVGPYGIVVVGSQVWVSNQGNRTILRYLTN